MLALNDTYRKPEMKILVIQIKHIGDAVATSMLFKRLKQLENKVETHYMLIASAKQAVLHNQDIDNFIDIDAKRLNSVRYLFGLLKQVRKHKFDMVLDVYGKPIGNLVSYFSGAKVRVGYDKARSGWIYTHKVNTQNQGPTSEAYALRDRKLFLKAIDADGQNLKPEIELNDTETKAATELLASSGLAPKDKLFMVSILGSDEYKSYPAAYMAEILEKVVASQPQINLLLNYVPSQLAQIEEILNLCGESTKQRIFKTLYADSIRGFLALLSHCNGIFGNEGGAINMAKALDVPSFAIYSPQIKIDSWSGQDERENDHPVVHICMYETDFTPLKKSMRAQQDEFYRKFKPSLFSDQLTSFIQKHAN